MSDLKTLAGSGALGLLPQAMADKPAAGLGLLPGLMAKDKKKPAPAPSYPSLLDDELEDRRRINALRDASTLPIK